MAALAKTKRRWTGNERALLRKLQNALNSLNARDQRVAERAEAAEAEGYYFSQDDKDPVQKAMVTLTNRIIDCLNEKV